MAVHDDAPGHDEAHDHDAELAARLRVVTARLARLLRQQAGTGLSPSQQSALASIELHDPLTLGDLAAVEQVAPPTVTKVVAKLEEQGLVDRTVDPTDRRITRVSITVVGRDRLEQSRVRRNAWLAARLGELGSDEVRRLGQAVEVLEALAAGAPSPARAPSDPTADTPSAAPAPSSPAAAEAARP